MDDPRALRELVGQKVRDQNLGELHDETSNERIVRMVREKQREFRVSKIGEAAKVGTLQTAGEVIEGAGIQAQRVTDNVQAAMLNLTPDSLKVGGRPRMRTTTAGLA